MRLTPFTLDGLDPAQRIVSTVINLMLGRKVMVGQLVMLGTLFALISLVFGLVISFDPAARGSSSDGRDR
jgi:hypothetical protein